jgi:hypothetical protein
MIEGRFQVSPDLKILITNAIAGLERAMRNCDSPIEVERRYFAEVAKRIPLEQMDLGLAEVKQKETKHRLTHGGHAPLSVFDKLLGPTTLSVQLVHRVSRDGEHVGFAARLREKGEATSAYDGMYHSTCNSYAWRQLKLVDGLLCNMKDGLGVGHPLYERPKRLGRTVHYEVPRFNVGHTDMFMVTIPEELIPTMSGAWKFFSNEEIATGGSEIVTSSLWQLRYVQRHGGRYSTAYLVETFPEEFRKAHFPDQSGIVWEDESPRFPVK